MRRVVILFAGLAAIMLVFAAYVGLSHSVRAWFSEPFQEPTEAAQRERIDARLLANTDDEELPSPEQLAALDEISRRVGGKVRADFNPLNGTLRLLFAHGSFLSEPSLDSPRAVAGNFLLDHGDLLAVSPEFVSGLVESRVFKNENSGIAHVQYEQRYEGLKVFQSTVRIAVTTEGRVLTVAGDYYPELSLPSTDPALSKEKAMDAAFGEVGPPLDLPPLESDPDSMTASVRELYAPTAELVVFPLPHKSAALAWRVRVPQFVSFWDVVVDANSGAVLYVDNLTKDDAEGQVFLEHPDAGAQVTVPFVGPLPAPRDAWVGANGFTDCATCTAGNNAMGLSDRDGVGDAYFAYNPDAHFNFGFANSWALTGDPDADEPTSITNLFYLNNVAHDHFYHLGFTEAAGNFQDDNFGAGGVGGDPVVAYTYFGYDSCPLDPPLDDCRNNALFATQPDGSISFMLMFLFTSPRRDPSFDGDIVIHEYSHGVSTRLVGVGGLSGTQSGAMGEGWSDYFPISFYDDPVMGEYVSGNAVIGGRRYAYDASPLTYGDLCTGSYGCEVHDDGEIWGVALWDLRQFYVSQLGLAAGQEAADGLVIEGLMLTAPSPSMLDGRDAILQAELALGGANQCAVWQVFADRGMGYSATSAGDTEVVTEAFDLPPACGEPIGPDVTVAKEDDPDPVASEGTLTYTLTVTNQGDAEASGVVVEDLLPSEVSTVNSVTPSQGSCSDTTPPDIRCELGAIGVGASATITIEVQAPTVSMDTTITNNAEVDPDNAIEESDETNNTAQESTLVSSLPDLTVTKTDDPDPVASEGTLTYTLTVTNQGGAEASGVVVEDLLPSEVSTVNSVTPSQGSCSDTTPPDIRCELGAIGVGASATVTIEVQAPTVSVDTTITNNAEVDPDNAIEESDETNNTAQESTLCGEGEGATIAIDPPSQEVPSGSFDVLVKEGLDVAGVAFSVDFDPAIIYVDSSTPGSFPPDCSIQVNNVDNSTGHIEFACITTPISGADAPGVVATYNFHCLVDNDSTLLDLEDELVDSNADPITPVTAQDGSIECRLYTDVTIYKADSPDPVGPMKVLTYTLSPENLGPASAVDVVVEDDLPPEASFISVTPGSPTCSHDGSPSGGTVTCDLGTLAVGMGPTITIQVEAPLTKVDQDLALDDPPNCASISASNEQPEDTANNEDCEATTCLARCPDVTGDLYISLVDLAKIALHWHHNACPPDDNWDVCLDLNQDCQVSLVDLAKVALHWHETCPSERVVVCPF